MTKATNKSPEFQLTLKIQGFYLSDIPAFESDWTTY